MKIIFAQGNPGAQYATTRHNVGFMVLDSLAGTTTFSPKPKFFAELAEVSLGGEKVLLVKPQTFYNETGRAARAILDFYKLTPADFLVVHDDLALPLGTIRTREKGSDGGNNGIKSLNSHVGADYSRIRIGIANDLRGHMSDADFVLGNFSKDEHTQLAQTLIPKSLELIEQFCANRLETTSHSL